jgi:hypothetical protein
MSNAKDGLSGNERENERSVSVATDTIAENRGDDDSISMFPCIPMLMVLIPWRVIS